MDNCPLISNATQTDGDALHPDAVSAWKFDEASGTTALDAVDSNPGTLTNGPTRVEPGKFGRSLGLNGTNAHVKINDAASLKPTTTLSMEAWVYLTRNNVSQVVVEKGDSNAGGYGMYVCQDGRPGYQFKVTGGVQSAASASALPLNQWHHLAATFDSGRTDRSKFYVDGVEVADSSAACLNVTNATGTLVQDTQPLEVGSRKGTSLFLQGQIDEVAVWSRALTGAEVTSHAQGLLFGDRLGDACDPCPSSASATCAPTTCLDQDGDGYGVQGSSACSGGLANFDCNDNDPAIHPGVVDSCDDVDNNCNGRKDEGCLAGAQTTTYQYNAFNQLVSLTGPVGTTTFTYDANGNQTSKVEPSGTTVFTYDARDRMVEVALPNGALGRFGYDTDNLRVRVEDSFGVRRLLLDGVDELSEYAVQAGRVARYDHDPSKVDALLAQLTAQGKVEAVSDALGSIYELTSGSGSALTRYAYDVYGARSASLEGVATKWGFTGRVREATFANAIYYRERELDTESGRWNAADPIGVADGVNRYAYVWGNSVLYVDPEGLRALIVTGIPEQIKLKKGGWYRPSPSQWGDLVKAALVGAGIVAADAIVRSVATSTDFKLIPVDMATSLKNEIDRIVVFTHFLNQCAPGDEGCGGPTTATRWAPGDALLPGTIASLVHQLQAYDVELIGCGGKSSSGQMKAIAKEVGVAIAYTASAVNYRVDMTGNDPATARMTITKFPGFATASPPAP
jgi:RHS repeat-associated protein